MSFFIRIKIQSSNTPGYAKVQTNENQTYNIYVNNNQTKTTNQNIEQIIEEHEDNENKKDYLGLLGLLGILGTGGLIRKGKGKGEIKEVVDKSLKQKAPKFEKMNNMSDKLRELNNYNMSSNEMKNTMKQNLELNGGYEKLTEEGKQQYDQLYNTVVQNQYNVQKDFINSSSYNEKELGQMEDKIKDNNETIKRYEDELKEMNLIQDNNRNLDQIRNKNIQYSQRTNDQMKSIYDKIIQEQEKEKQLKQQQQTKEGIQMQDLKQEQNLSFEQFKQDVTSGNFILDSYPQNTQKQIESLRQNIVKEQDKLYDQRLTKYSYLTDEELNKEMQNKQNQINELKQNNIKLQDKIDKGVREDLYSWLDHLPEKYQKNKQGLIDYTYDSFKEKQEGPFDTEIYRYNKYDGNDELLEYRQGNQIQDKMDKNKNKIKEILRQEDKNTKQKIQELTEQIKQVIPKQLQEDPHVKKIIDQLSKGEMTTKDAVNEIGQMLKDQSKNLLKYNEETIKPLLGLDKDKILTREQKDNQGLAKLADFVTKGSLKDLSEQIPQVSDILNDLGDAVLSFNEGHGLNKVNQFIQKNKEKLNSVTQSLNKITQKIGETYGTINDFAQEIFNSPIVKNIPGVSAISGIMNDVKDIIPTVNETISYVSNLKNKSPLELLVDVSSSLTKRLPEEAQSKVGGVINKVQDIINQSNEIKGRRIKEQQLSSNSYDIYEQRIKQQTKQPSIEDVSLLLSQDLAKQNRQISTAKEQGNIFFRDYLTDEKGEKINLNQLQRPTQEEEQKINQLIQEQQNILNDKDYQNLLDITNNSYDLNERFLILEDYIRQQKRELNEPQYNDKRIKELQEETENQRKALEQLTKQKQQIERKTKSNKNLEDLKLKLQYKNNKIQSLQQEINYRQADRDYNLLPKLEQQKNDYTIERNMIQQQIDEITQKNPEMKTLLQQKDQIEKQIQQETDLLNKNMNELNQAQDQHDNNIKIINKNIKEAQNDINKYYSQLHGDNINDYVLSRGKIYNKNQLQEQLNEYNNRINDIEDELSKYQSQMNYMNKQKYKNPLEPEIRQMINQNLNKNSISREQEELKWRKNGRFDPHVPIPGNLNVTYKPKNHKFDTVEQTNKKLKDKGFEQKIQYKINNKQMNHNQQDYKLDYDGPLNDELDKLFKDYESMMKQNNNDLTKLNELKEQYEKEYDETIKRFQENIPIDDESEITISQLQDFTPEQNKINYNQLKKQTDKYLSSYNRKSKNKSNDKYHNEIEQLKLKNGKDNNKTQNDFYMNRKKEYDNLRDKQLNRDNIKEYNKFLKDLNMPDNNKQMQEVYKKQKPQEQELQNSLSQQIVGPKQNYQTSYSIYLPQIKDDQSIKQYLSHNYPKSVYEKYNPSYMSNEQIPSYFGLQPPKKSKAYAPYQNRTFTFEQQLLEDPIEQYIDSIGLGNIDIADHQNAFQYKDTQDQLNVINQAIQDDILFKYNGKNKKAIQTRDLLLRDPQNVRQVSYVNPVYNTKQIKDRLKKLQYIQDREKFNLTK